MKKKFYYALFAVLMVAVNTYGQPDLVPNTDNQSSLGTTSLRWKDIHLSHGLFLVNSLTIHASGVNNFFAGANSGKTTLTGTQNTGTGTNALFSITSGSFNTAVGFNTLSANTSGFSNVAVGRNALSTITTNFKNTAVGNNAMAFGLGDFNTAIGTNALERNNNKNNIVAIGDSALFNNGIGATSSVHGEANVAVGSKSLVANGTGFWNNGIGYQSLVKNSSGSRNVGLGTFSLANNTTGAGNVGIGGGAGNNSNDNNNCTFLGLYAGGTTFVANQGFSNSTAIGFNAAIIGSNQVRIGNSSIVSIKGQVGFSTFSDGRFKKNIKEDVPGLTFINKLKAVTYHLDVTGMSKLLKEQNPEAQNERMIVAKAIAEKEKVVYTGFTAQDVEKAAKEIGYDFSGVDAPQSKEDHYALRYAEFVVPLVKAVQELSKENDDLKERLEKLEALVQDKKGSLSVAETIHTTLEQNAPNPFTQQTNIRYNIPGMFRKASLLLTSANGQLIRQENISTAKGVITISAGSLSAGNYNYSLIIDGKIADSKRMLITK